MFLILNDDNYNLRKGFEFPARPGSENIVNSLTVCFLFQHFASIQIYVLNNSNK